MSATFAPNPAFRRAFEASALATVEAGAEAFAGYVKRSFSQGRGPSRPGTPPAVGSGRLRRSVRETESFRQGSGVANRVISDTPYSRIHEYGGVINARDRSLTIPVSDRARALRASTDDLTTLNLTWRPSRAPGTNGLLFEGDELMFVLKDSVTIPERSFFRTAVRSKSAGRDVIRAMGADMRSRFGGRRAG